MPGCYRIEHKYKQVGPWSNCGSLSHDAHAMPVPTRDYWCGGLSYEPGVDYIGAILPNYRFAFPSMGALRTWFSHWSRQNLHAAGFHIQLLYVPHSRYVALRNQTIYDPDGVMPVGTLALV